MQPFEFSLGIEGSEMIQKAGPERPAHNESIRRPETIPGKLLESLARFRFVSGIDRKPALGLFQKGKPIGGLNHKKCHFFQDDTLRGTKRTAGQAGQAGHGTDQLAVGSWHFAERDSDTVNVFRVPSSES